MKRIFSSTLTLFIGLLVFQSCKKTSGNYVNDSLSMDTTAMLKYTGNFISGPYGIVTGAAKIYLKNNAYTVGLENFNTGSGPDLKVYLSKEVIPMNFISLGSLQSTNGNQLYAIPGTPDFSVYKYVLIHCEQFNHLFGSAELQ